MEMPAVFYQNMDCFDGKDTKRNSAFENAFNKVKQNAEEEGRQFYGGGFSEIMNQGSAQYLIEYLVKTLLAPSNISTLAYGKTSLADGNPEFCTIASSATPIAIGRIFFQDIGVDGVRLIHDPAPSIPIDRDWAKSVPSRATFDYRGLVYHILNIPRPESMDTDLVCVGYLNNRYEDLTPIFKIIKVLPKIQKILWSVMKRKSELVYLGGTFAIAPTDFHPWYQFNGGATTEDGNPDDYWFSLRDNHTAPPPKAIVDNATLLPPKISNHGFIAIRSINEF